MSSSTDAGEWAEIGGQDELAECVSRLVEHAPFRGYLSAEKLMEIAQERLRRSVKPRNLRLWLNGVAQESLLVALVCRDLNADRAAAEVFYSQLRLLLGPTIRSSLRSSSLPRDWADDLIQTAYRRLADHIQQHGCLPLHLTRWLTSVVRNRIREFFRKPRAQPMSEDVLEMSEPLLNKLADRETVELLLAGMEPFMREVYRLRYQEGLSWAAVAETMGMTENVVAVRWSRWLKRARAQVEG